MNYIGLINNFWNKYKTSPVSPGASALFFLLLHHANVRMWQFPIYLTNEFLTADMHTTKSSFLRYRGELKLNGYISCEPKNRLLGSEYYILISDKKLSAKHTFLQTDTDTESGTASNTLIAPNSGLSSYNKKTKKENLNQYFKPNLLKNNYEIYNSGRYDFDKIEKAARQKILDVINAPDNENNS